MTVAINLPFGFYKANLWLWMSTTRSVFDLKQQCLALSSRRADESTTEARAAAKELRASNDWQTLVTLPMGTLWHAVQKEAGDAHVYAQIAMRSQASYALELEDALSGWQKAVANILGHADLMTPFYSPLLRNFVQGMNVLGVRAAQPTGVKSDSK
ncbi:MULTISPECIES: hypothetical protein [Burkholderia cepacia complex]|uniref:hypothetical protein n=1 Tax=Burkholderia cepacia complex TaxID=87882 RepID=UPI001CF4A39D|nr:MULTISPECIES: hypothetical protein [Burkholderia cepacia complex]MCA8057343.1 hypothetical protein [Burkholderia cepacia]